MSSALVNIQIKPQKNCDLSYCDYGMAFGDRWTGLSISEHVDLSKVCTEWCEKWKTLG